MEEWSSGAPGSMQCNTYAVQHRCSAVQHNAVQCSTLPHRSRDAQPSSGDMSRRVGDLVLNYRADTTSGDRRWIERNLLPLYEAVGMSVELRATAELHSGNDEAVDATWTLICTEVYWRLVRDWIAMKLHNADDQRDDADPNYMVKVENGLKNMKLHDIAHWRTMKKKEIEDFTPVNTMQRMIKLQLQDRIKEVQEFQQSGQKVVSDEIFTSLMQDLI